jgi:hypothetical protein
VVAIRNIFAKNFLPVVAKEHFNIFHTVHFSFAYGLLSWLVMLSAAMGF